MLKAKLLVVGGDAKSGEFELRLPTTIGRGREASLTLPHPLVSRLHCEITEHEGMLLVKDLGSTNGTFVNNQKLEGQATLEPNQLLTLGNVTFRADYQIGCTIPEEVLAAESKSELQRATELQTIRATVPTANQKETVYDDQKKSDTDLALPEVSAEVVAKLSGESGGNAGSNCLGAQAVAASSSTKAVSVTAGNEEPSVTSAISRKLPR